MQLYLSPPEKCPNFLSFLKFEGWQRKLHNALSVAGLPWTMLHVLIAYSNGLGDLEQYL